MGIFTALLIYVFLGNTQYSIALNNSNTQSILLQQLLDNYGPITVRPVRDVNQPTNVTFRLLPVELINFDEGNQQVKLSAYMRMGWRDENMIWDPEDFDGITSVTVKQNNVWLPDIVLYQNVVKDFVSYADTYIIVTNNGMMDWYFPAIMASACPIDITYFPYDVQHCNLTFGPWSQTHDQVNFTRSTQADANVNLFHRNGVWILEKTTSLDVLVDSCCFNHSWSSIVFSLQIRRQSSPWSSVVLNLQICRQSSFYTRTVVVPSILLTALMALVCWLHPASGEKVTLAVSNLLALILFQQLVADRLPPSGETTSIIVIFFIVMIGLSCAEVICSIIVLRLYHMGGRRQIPAWLRRAMLHPFILHLYTNPDCTTMLRAEDKANEIRKMSMEMKATTQNSMDVSSNNQESGMVEDKRANVVIRTISQPPDFDTLSLRSDPELVTKTWQEAAIVCDKFLFTLLLLVTFSAWLYVLISFLGMPAV